MLLLNIICDLDNLIFKLGIYINILLICSSYNIYCMYALYGCVCVSMCVCVCGGGGGGNLDGVMHNLKLYIVHMPVISCRSIKGE